MSLLSRIAQLVRGPQAQAAPKATTSQELPQRQRQRQGMSQLSERFQLERDRRAIVEICRRMYDEDDRAEGVLRTLGRDVAKGGFQVKVHQGTGAPAARKIAEELLKRLKLESRVDDWTRLTTRDGDTMLQVVIDADMDIVKVVRMPTLEMHRNSDETDQFQDPARAYWQSDQLYGTHEPPNDATWFADWQIVHARWGHDEGYRYGRPLFASARGSWKKLTEGEIDIAVRRKTRSGLKYHHQFPEGTDETAIEEYIELNKDALGNPNAATADFFGTPDIKVIQGDAKLAEIDDVLHHLRTWFIAAPVPMPLLGYGQDLNRDVLKEQKDQYERALESLISWVDEQLIRPLVELQWLLKGIWPGSLKYEILHPSREPITAELLKSAGEAAKSLREGGLPEELTWEMVARLLPGVDVERIKELLAQEAEAKAREAAERPPAPVPAGQVPPDDDEEGQDEREQGE